MHIYACMHTNLFSIDINECHDDNGQCSSICNNTNGSYFCSCDPGYILDADEYNCSGL